jgi:hypothetical protein
MSSGRACAITFFAFILLLTAFHPGLLWGQTASQGTVTVVIVDQGGAVVPGADLTLRDLSTNVVREGTSQSMGTYSFVGLTPSTYKLSASKSGYATTAYDSVSVHAGLVTDIKATLKVGAVSETVEVKADAVPLVESTSSAIGTTIDLKFVEDLPFGTDRDLTQLVTLAPGYTGYTPGMGGAYGTVDGLPGEAQVTAVDGVIGQSSRGKAGGNANPNGTAVSPRIQNIQEMSIQSDQLDANQGYGQGDMQVTFVTRSGTNHFHGRLFGDLQNSSFNANSWMNDFYLSQGDPYAAKPLYHKTDLGGSLGGPIIKDKLFFFFAFERDGIPGMQQPQRNFITQAMQQGNYTYKSTVDGSLQTVNLLTLAGQAGLAYTVDSGVAAELAQINSVVGITGKAQGTVVNLGTQAGLYNVNALTFKEPNNQYYYYPTLRLDYYATQKLRVNFAWNESKIDLPNTNAQLFPGSTFSAQNGGSTTRAYTMSLGFDYTISPTLINQFRGGFLYNYYAVDQNAANYPEKYKLINWWNGPDGLNASNSYYWYSALSNFYPLINFSDSVVWQHKSHNLSFGGSFYREQDHYWNDPLGYDNVVFGDWPGDPMNNVFTASNLPSNFPVGMIGAVQGYYAILTGDIGIIAGSRPVNPQTGGYSQYGAVNLDELQKGWSLHFQDSWRVRPNLTVNYGMRWDFTGDDHDLNGVYYSPDQAGIYGVSGFNNLFNPGSELGNASDLSYIRRVHAYSPWNVSPQPNLGFAWSPQYTEGLLGKLTGGGKTVLRGGYSLRRYTTQYQTFYNFASGGQFYYQNYQIQGATPGTTTTGYFPAGSVSFSEYLNGAEHAPYPATCGQTQYFVSPCTFSSQITEASQAFESSIQGINPHIAQPYIQSWNVGLQRKLGQSNAIEVRYVGNRGIHEWLGLNPNETNIFENGFLSQFKVAQQNLSNYMQANPGCASTNSCSFAGSNPAQNLPIFQAAFAGEGLGADGNYSDYSFGTFLTNLELGQVGSLANSLSSPSGNAAYLCNLVPLSSKTGQACVNNEAYTGAGGSYPENLFQANPYYGGQASGYLTAAGYSNYNGLQLEFRQQSWHGMQFNANYTWSKNLAVTQQNTLHNLPGVHGLRESYGPALTDRRNVMNTFGTYDLPFGKGKSYLNRNDLLNRLVGGWTLGTVVTYTSGYPFQLTGGNQTFNSIVDGGIVLNGVTVSQIQHAIGLNKMPCPSGECTGYVPGERTWINPKFIAADGEASSQIAPNTVPGTIGAHPWFYGMHHFNENMSISKAIAIKEGLRLNLQGEFVNLFNHPEWDVSDNLSLLYGNEPPTQVQVTNFGLTTDVGGSRVIEVRANFEF